MSKEIYTSDYFYRHYRGGAYQILCIAVQEKDKEAIVVYRNLEDGVVWTRPYSEFYGNAIHNGKEVRRFEPIKSVFTSEEDDTK